jgi:hypothetical protein
VGFNRWMTYKCSCCSLLQLLWKDCVAESLPYIILRPLGSSSIPVDHLVDRKHDGSDKQSLTAGKFNFSYCFLIKINIFLL